MNKKDKVIKILEIFDQLYPEAECSLEYWTPLQLLISTQLAAQCTDARVNIVSQELYKKYRGVEDFANADLAELEQDIKPTGFYRNKAKNIIACCRQLLEKHNGKIPDNMEDLLKLPGVGRKTANLVLFEIYGIQGVVVDTHAKRLTNHIGLTKNQDPEKIEYDLQKIVPKDRWADFCHKLVFHGRAVCNARKPDCENCKISSFCDYYNKK
ncbi:ultraviolet N-glycosylase/AP lyase [Ruminiclostridium hungatei]|uniref:Endonuclease III n=1 Tax=Ruminiclostridium hungatei TaxID=48256 RepID=A0A1V4SER7_RUMHU|nr:endonuclease III [Ruminiclostridium hungatei]OPX41965.1 ultraviolet N-glycosylase/AP lyase [Ruminiclostridium hungatei]